MGVEQFSQEIIAENFTIDAGEVDVDDRAGRVLGKIRYMDTSETLQDLAEKVPNASGVYTDSHGDGGSFGAQAVSHGYSVVYKADAANGGTVTLDGFPLEAGEGIALQVDDVSAPNTSVPAGDTVHAIVED